MIPFFAFFLSNCLAQRYQINETQNGFFTQFLNESHAKPWTFNGSACPTSIVAPNVRVACNADGSISQLYLGHWTLHGNLTPTSSLFKLTDLVYLNLTDNQLQGEVSALAALRKLEALDLSYNAFTGDGLALAAALPSLTSCVLQMPTPYDTNCFTGLVWQNASICSWPTENPLYLCRTYIPRIAPPVSVSPFTSTTAMTSTTTTTTTTIPLNSSSPAIVATAATTFVSQQTVGTLATVSTPNTQASARTSQTSRNVLTSSNATESTAPLELKMNDSLLAPPPSSSSPPSTTANGNSATVIVVILAVALAFVYVAIVAYVIARKIKAKREDENQRNDQQRDPSRKSSPWPLSYLDTVEGGGDGDAKELRVVSAAAAVGGARRSKSEYDIVDLNAIAAHSQMRTSSGYSNLPVNSKTVPRAVSRQRNDDANASESKGKKKSLYTRVPPLPVPFQSDKYMQQQQHGLGVYDKVPLPPAISGSKDSRRSHDDEASYDAVRMKKDGDYDSVSEAKTDYVHASMVLEF